MLERWSGGQYRPTLHRWVGRDRRSYQLLARWPAPATTLGGPGGSALRTRRQVGSAAPAAGAIIACSAEPMAPRLTRLAAALLRCLQGREHRPVPLPRLAGIFLRAGI